MGERSSVTTYFRVDTDILDDPALIDLTFDHGPMVLSTWIVLLAFAKQQRNLGLVTTSIRLVCRMVGDRPNGSFPQRVALWEGMIERGLITLESGTLEHGEVIVRINKWHDKQSLTSSERQKLYRQRAKVGEPAPKPPKGEKVYVLSDGTGGLKVGYTSVPIKRRIANLQTGLTGDITLVATWPGTRVEERELQDALAEHHVRGEWFVDCDASRAIVERYANDNGVPIERNGVTTQGEQGEENKQPVLPPSLPSVDQSSPPPPTKAGDDIARIFDYWKRRRKKPAGVRLTKERRAKIKARLGDGFTPLQLKAVIDYYHRDPFHNGENPEHKVYDDLITWFRNETKVQSALEKIAVPEQDTVSTYDLEYGVDE